MASFDGYIRPEKTAGQVASFSTHEVASMKQTIRIRYVDFWEGFSKETFFIHKILSGAYTLVEDAEKPDFLICSCFGDAHWSYDCVKIYYTGENVTPDFNMYDYAIGFDELLFSDRYLRVPLYRLYGRPYPDWTFPVRRDIAQAKTKFCNFLYSNSAFASPEREYFFRLLSHYKQVDSGGGAFNNIGEWVKDKLAWQRDYKFSIAFENSSKPGYTTEKIIDPLSAQTIPIYWGNPDIAKDFNAKRFINCHDYSSFDEVVERVKELDADDGKYAEVLSQPWFPEGKQPAPLTEDPAVIAFLTNIIEQGPERARRTVNYGMTRHIYRERARRDRIAGSLSFRVAAKLQRILSPRP